MVKFFKEFKEFAVKGNVIDIAIGVIIGAAFNDVIDAIVEQLLMPPLSLLTNGLRFENKKWILQESIPSQSVEEIAIGYGQLIETCIDFVIIAIAVFLIVKAMNRLKSRSEDIKDPVIETPADIALLHRIADSLERQNELLEKKNK